MFASPCQEIPHFTVRAGDKTELSEFGSHFVNASSSRTVDRFLMSGKMQGATYYMGCMNDAATWRIRWNDLCGGGDAYWCYHCVPTCFVKAYSHNSSLAEGIASFLNDTKLRTMHPRLRFASLWLSPRSTNSLTILCVARARNEGDLIGQVARHRDSDWLAVNQVGCCRID